MVEYHTYGETRSKNFLSKPILPPKINNQITAPELRVIGVAGENLGVLSRDAALALVRHEEGIDLIEIAPMAKPPVARLMSFDKYRYERGKAEKKERLAQKGAGLKQIQISARSAHNDLLIKIKKLEEFMKEGHPIEIQMRLRGREKYNKTWALQKLREFLAMIPIEYKEMSSPKFGGRGVGMHIIRK